ncbi:hypothetical protein [Streptosporangium oxazolinicum]|uniref:hypothetical protein n=1 Tax=Streptosporangium oxazolinicum TaxID=909287 RepID=UPI0031E96DC5
MKTMASSAHAVPHSPGLAIRLATAASVVTVTSAAPGGNRIRTSTSSNWLTTSDGDSLSMPKILGSVGGGGVRIRVRTGGIGRRRAPVSGMLVDPPSWKCSGRPGHLVVGGIRL